MFNKNGHHGLITGLLIGAVFALIFAPQKGKMVREKIHNAHKSGEDVLEPLKHSFFSLFSEVVRIAKTANTEKGERNPFTITNIRNYARK
ncbi:YtxH domain-containing protein [Patescibacteria group bacterium]